MIAVAGAVAYDGWLFYSRWRDRRQAEEQSRAKAAEDAGRTLEMLGGGRLRILNFYANPGVIQPGGRANICYGVYGASSVRIQPPVADLHPAVARCIEVSPAKTTEYRLVAADDQGHTATESFVLRVE